MIETFETASAVPVADAATQPPEQAAVKPADETSTETGTVASDAQPSEAEAEAEGAEELDASGKPRGKDKRIDQLTRRWREAERERDALRAQLMQLQAQMSGGAQPQPQPQQALGAQPPDPSKYPLGVVDEQYHRDFVSYQQRIAHEAAYQAMANMVHQAFVQQLSEAYEERAKELFGDLSELREAEERVLGVLAQTQIGNAVGQAVSVSEVGPLVMKYLADHPDELRRLRKMTPALAARHIGRLEERLIAERKTAATTKAPPPPRTVRGGSTATADPLAMTDEQFREHLLRNVLKRR